MATAPGRAGPASPARRISSQVNVAELTEIAANKALKSQKPRAIEPGRYTTIIEPRPIARLLSTMMGAFNARRRRAAAFGGGGGGGGGFNFGGIGRPFVNADGTPKIGQKLFSDSFTLKSDIGNPILRQTPIMNDGAAGEAGDVGREGRAEERLLRCRHGAAAEGRAVRRQRRT